MSKFNKRTLLFALFSLPAALATGAPALAQSDQQLLEEYVNRAVASLPGQNLPAYDTSYDLARQLCDNVEDLPGLSSPLWRGASVVVRLQCAAWGPASEVDYSSSIIGPPIQASDQAELIAMPLLSIDEGVRFVAFYNIGTGLFHVFQISQVSDHPSSSNYCIAAPNSASPGGARMDLSGSRSITDNTLVLRAGPVPDQMGIFFVGDVQVEQPFGNGFRCVGGSIRRLPIEQAAGGVLQHALDFTDPSSQASQLVSNGHSIRVQAWYRDPAAGGAGFNLSDGLTLLLCP